MRIWRADSVRCLKDVQEGSEFKYAAVSEVGSSRKQAADRGMAEGETKVGGGARPGR